MCPTMLQNAFDIEFWLKNPQVECKAKKKKKKKQKLSLEAKFEAKLLALAENEFQLEYETLTMASESEVTPEKYTEITPHNEMLSGKITEMFTGTKPDFEKSQKMKKSLQDSVSSVERAIIQEKPFDDQYFMIAMFFGLCVNNNH